MDRRRPVLGPVGGAGIDPERQMSVIYDNRSRISTRLKQLTHRQALRAGAAVEPAPADLPMSNFSGAERIPTAASISRWARTSWSSSHGRAVTICGVDGSPIGCAARRGTAVGLQEGGAGGQRQAAAHAGFPDLRLHV